LKSIDRSFTDEKTDPDIDVHCGTPCYAGQAKETVSKLNLERAFSPFACCDSFPGALPQAGIDRTFGALKHNFKAVKAPKARTIPAWAKP
jgi:hypothetical protein